MRLITAASFRDHCQGHFRDLQNPPLSSLFIRQTLLYVKLNQEKNS